MRFLTKIEVVDSNGNEFSEMTGPIPFSIRVHLEDGMNRYRVRLIDDMGNTRGQYSGVTAQKHLDLYVPFIKLPKLGKLRILVEESTGEPKYSHQHQISILYLEYTLKKTSQINQVYVNRHHGNPFPLLFPTYTSQIAISKKNS